MKTLIIILLAVTLSTSGCATSPKNHEPILIAMNSFESVGEETQLAQTAPPIQKTEIVALPENDKIAERTAENVGPDVQAANVAPSLTEQPRTEPQTGDEIAEELRTMQPEENTKVSGVLIINKRQKIPVVCNVVADAGKDSWQVIYETLPTTNSPAEKLVVIRSLSGPNKYMHARAATPTDPMPKPKLLAPNEAAIPFAGSDFWLSELGFDFLHWPLQKKLKGEMRLGQPCFVLESINPDAPVVVRMKSYIAKESYQQGQPGILIAEGYDRDKKLVKDFSLGGSSFKKVNGQWQLKKMKITSPKTDSETVLEFDLPKEIQTKD